MILRQARMGDATGICALYNTLIRDTTATFTTRERAEADVAADIALRWAGFLVAVEDDHVAGFATFGPFREGPGYDHTRELTIQMAPKAQGRGFGRALLRRLEQVALDQGVHVLVAGISGTNRAAQAFHSACGFVETGRMARVGFKSGQWLDLVLMQKVLAAPDTDADSTASLG